MFRSGTVTDPPRAGIRIAERDTPRPATCVALLDRAGARGRLTGSPHRLPSQSWRSSRCPRSSTSPLVHEAIAAAVPDRECIVWRDRRLTWAEVTDRTRRFASVLTTRRPGHAPTRWPTASRWESPHDHVALYLHNGNEYLEALLGAAKARAVGVNINYRYVADELRYVLRRRRARAVVYHGSFAADARRGAARTSPHVELLLQVDDGSGAALLPGAIAYEVGAGRRRRRSPPVGLSPDDLYILYTGGTTACPRACSGARPTSSPPASGVAQHHGRAGGGRRARRPADAAGARRSCTGPPTGTPSAPGSPAAPW